MSGESLTHLASASLCVCVPACVCLHVCACVYNARNTHYATNYIAAAAADDVEAEADLNLYCILCGVAGVFNLSSQCAFHVHNVASQSTSAASVICLRAALLFIFCLNFTNFYYFSKLCLPLSVCLTLCLSAVLFSLCPSLSLPVSLALPMWLGCCFNVLSNVTKLS